MAALGNTTDHRVVRRQMRSGYRAFACLGYEEGASHHQSIARWHTTSLLKSIRDHTGQEVNSVLLGALRHVNIGTTLELERDVPGSRSQPWG